MALEPTAAFTTEGFGAIFAVVESLVAVRAVSGAPAVGAIAKG